LELPLFYILYVYVCGCVVAQVQMETINMCVWCTALESMVLFYTGELALISIK